MNDPSGARPAVLAVRGAFKAFGTVKALDDASIELLEGERLGLLGPNGAGKTTLLRAITGRVRLDRGTVELFDREVRDGERRRAIGVVPQEIAVYPLLNSRENLEVFGRLHGVAARDLKERVEWALAWTALGDHARRKVGEFSGGMKRRLNIACGVLHRPRIVLLDEPTVGVDPQSRERIYDMLEELRSEGASMLLTTHHLEEAEARCDRIAILDHGRLIAAGTLSDLVTRTIGHARDVVIDVDRAPANGLDGFADSREGRRLTVRVGDVGAELPGVLSRVAAAGCRIENLEVVRQGLHEVFLHLTGRELRE